MGGFPRVGADRYREKRKRPAARTRRMTKIVRRTLNRFRGKD